MKLTARKLGAVLMALVVITSMGAAAAITWDTANDANSTTTSDVSGSTTTVNWYPDNSSKEIYVEVDSAGSENLSLRIQHGASDINDTYYENDTPDTVNATSGNYAWTISHTELESDLPTDWTGGTYDIVVYNETSEKNVLESELVLSNQNGKTTARIFVSNTSTTSKALGASLIADSLTLEDKGGVGAWAAKINVFSDSNTTKIATFSDTVDVNGTNTTVEFVMKEDDTVDAFDASVDGYEDGSITADGMVMVNNELVPYYAHTTPDDVDENATYAVYDESTDTLTVNVGDEHDAKGTTLSVKSVAGDGPGFWEAMDAFGISEAIKLQSGSIGR